MKSSNPTVILHSKGEKKNMRLSECYLPLISATVMQPRKKKRINKIQYVMLSTTSQLNMF